MAGHAEDDAPEPGKPASPLGYETTRALGPGGKPREAGERPRPTPPVAAPTVRIGRYQLGALLGQGGMGVVYRARDPQLDRALAIKLVRATGGEPDHARVLREAQAMARLRHPHVVPVFDVGVHAGAIFLVMPLLEGGTLGGWLRGARRPWRAIVTRFLAAGRGLAAAHAVGLVHRDFKPENVLLGADDEVQVADFGLARATGDVGAGGEVAAASPLTVDVTATGTVLGTPAYMAPEQLDGEAVDARADQFGFCVALFEALYRRRPFALAGDRPADLSALREAIHAGPERVARADGDAPAWLRAMVERGLREAPAQRWPTMTALIAAIERRLRRPRRVALAVGSGAALVGVAITAVVVAGDGGAGAPGPPRFLVDRASRATYAGCAAAPAFAPDGARLAYGQRRGSATTLIVRDLASGAERTLGPGGEPAFSPDGRYLAALERGQIVVHDLQDPAAAPRPAGASTSGPTWLDGRELLAGVGNQVVARAVADGAERALGRVPAGHVVRATTIGDDRRVFVIHRADASLAEAVVAELRADGTTRELRRGVLSSAGLHYAADAGLVYFVQRRNTNQYQLFAQPIEGGEVIPLPTDGAPAGGFDLSGDRRRLAFSSCAESARIVTIARSGELAGLTAAGAWRDNAPLAVDAGRVIHTSTRSGLLQLWLLDRATGDDRPLVPPESSQPALSPDRTTLVYSAVSGSRLGLRAVPLAGPASPRVLTDGHVDRAARVTRDGATVVFLRETAGGQALHRVPVAGGAETPLLADAATVRAFDLSPVDDTLAYVVPGDIGPTLWRMSLAGADRQPVPGGETLGSGVRFVRFAPDGRRLLVVDGDGRLLELTLATGAVERRWQLEGTDHAGVGAVDYDVDGATLLVSLTSRAGDLWIADGRF